MLLLTSTTDLIEVVTDSAATVDVHASYVDLAAAVVTPGRKNTAIASATTTIVAAPGAATQRNVKTLHLRNKHASTSVGVTVRHTDGTTVVELVKATLLAGETLSYVEGEGFVVRDANGAVKGPAALVTTRTLAADQSNSTTTPTEVTGLELVSVQPGTYQFVYHVVYQAAATTTGVRLSVNFTGTQTAFVAFLNFMAIVAADATAGASQAQVLSTGAPYRGFSARAPSTAGWSSTISVDVANANMLITIEGTIVVTVAGNLELWHGSEVAAASTVKAGSSVVLTRVG